MLNGGVVGGSAKEATVAFFRGLGVEDTTALTLMEDLLGRYASPDKLGEVRDLIQRGCVRNPDHLTRVLQYLFDLSHRTWDAAKPSVVSLAGLRTFRSVDSNETLKELCGDSLGPLNHSMLVAMLGETVPEWFSGAIVQIAHKVRDAGKANQINFFVAELASYMRLWGLPYHDKMAGLMAGSLSGLVARQIEEVWVIDIPRRPSTVPK